MDNQNILRQFLRAVFHELFRSKATYNIVASLILLGVVAFGYIWQERYVSTASITLAQSASVADNKVRLNQLKNVFDTHVFQDDVSRLLSASVFHKQSSEMISSSWLEQNTDLVIFPRGIAKLQLSAASPSEAQLALSLVVNGLLERFQPKEDLALLHEKGDVLRQQELSLKKEIRENEESIRNVSGVNGGALGTASARATSLRQALQDVEVTLSAVDATILGIERRIKDEETLLNYLQRKQGLEEQKQKNTEALNEALELYSSVSPEVVSLQKTLDNIALEIASLEENKPENLNKTASNDAFYEKLRQRLTLQELEKESLESKKVSLQRLLASETKKVLQDKDQLDRAQGLNSEILAAKSKLDLVQREITQLNQKLREQKQNDSRFIVLDAPSLPQNYSGLGFIEFLLLGPVLAFGFPFLIASIIVLSDSSIRTARALNNVSSDVPVLGVIPHYNSPINLRLFRKAMIGVVAWLVFVFIVYFTIGVIGLKA